MVENINEKFDEVVTDIVMFIANLSYDDVEKEILRNELLLNLNVMCENYDSYLHALSVLNEDKNQQAKTYSKSL